MKISSKILAGTALLVVGSTAAYAAAITVGGTPVVSTSTGGVLVTADVQPTLSMDISTGSIALGSLSTSLTTGSVGIEVGTNAKDGVTVTAASTNAGLSSTTANHLISDAGLTNEAYSFASALGTADGQIAGTQSNLSSTQITNTSAVTIYSNNKPEPVSTANSDVTFTVGAQIDNETPAASDYSDTIVFTVTGTY